MGRADARSAMDTTNQTYGPPRYTLESTQTGHPDGFPCNSVMLSSQSFVSQRERIDAEVAVLNLGYCRSALTWL